MQARPPGHDDPLREAWREAQRLDGDDAPPPQVRVRILANARAPDARAESRAGGDVRRSAPANDSRWRITAVASVMAMSLAGLLAWQLRHGAPDDGTAPGDAAMRPAAQAPVAQPTPAAPSANVVRPTTGAPPTTAVPPSDAERPVPRGEPERIERRAAPAAIARRAPEAADDRAPSDRKSEAPAEKAAEKAAAEPGMAARAPAELLADAPGASPGPAVDSAPAPAGAPAAAEAFARHSLGAPVTPARRLRAAAADGDLDGMRRALAAGAAVDAPGPGGRTALIVATTAGHLAAVRLLLQAGADPNRADDGGITPLRHARALPDPAIAGELAAAGAR